MNRAQTAPNAARSAKTHITVVVRVRPPNAREVMSQQGNAIQILDDRVLVFDPPGERPEKTSFIPMGQQRAKNLHFGFDKVLSPDSSQEDVFRVVKDCIFTDKGGLLDGFNCTVFAYGATGSGKTFSMAGTPENPGLMSRAVQYIFSTLEKQGGRKAKLKLSYLEIYNERVRDLLSPANTKELKIVEDPEHGIMVTNLTHCYPANTDEVLELIQLGNSRRTQAETEANPVSSRSHAVCQITVENCEQMPGLFESNPIGKLSLIDLAGSERATTNTGIRLKESAKINCSLLALSNCINALCTQSSFIPFRQSKLTRLLKDSLGGNCKTVCLSCVSPSYMTYDDTYSTLQYANKTKNIRTNISRNMLNVKARVAQYPKIIAELRAQILDLQTHGPNSAIVNSFQKSIDGPFLQRKDEISEILNEVLECFPENDIKQQTLYMERMANVDLEKQIDAKLVSFLGDCDGLRPTGEHVPTAMIDSAQRLKVLELENFALRQQLRFRDKQLELHQSLIKALNERQSSQTSRHTDGDEEVEVRDEVVVTEDEYQTETDSESEHSEHENRLQNESKTEPQCQRESESETESESESDSERTDSASEEESQRRENIGIDDANKEVQQEFVGSETSFRLNSVSSVRSISQATELLKQKLQAVSRQPLAERTPRNVAFPPTSKAPLRSLMDQLAQRVAAATQRNSTGEQTAILLRSRLINQRT